MQPLRYRDQLALDWALIEYLCPVCDFVLVVDEVVAADEVGYTCKVFGCYGHQSTAFLVIRMDVRESRQEQNKEGGITRRGAKQRRSSGRNLNFGPETTTSPVHHLRCTPLLFALVLGHFAVFSLGLSFDPPSPSLNHLTSTTMSG